MCSEYDNLVDFSDLELVDYDDMPLDKESATKTPNIIYDKRTIEYYKVMRSRKMDPILSMDIDDKISFEYPYIWDPYTGNASHVLDPDGPLSFHPDVLIHYFYTNRLNNLWVEPVDDIVNGYFQGYYDMAVGTGENVAIQGRGEYPEKYLFRIPIIDCYLTKDHNDMVVTMGPKLSDADIATIYNKALKLGDNYKLMFGRNRPNLIKMKEYYDQALSTKPSYDKDLSNISVEKKQEIYYKLNRVAVDCLRSM